ncbi:MAG TPA: hypothetical protein VHW60_18245, partial [Caulobacteraceae bacterium]|nr:hypothetical protein [Caulobacteraceae bacterium]
MTMKTSLCGGAALVALLALGLTPAAMAKTPHRHYADPAASAAAAERAEMKNEVDELKQQVAALEDWKNQQAQTQAQTQAQVSDLQGQLTQANARADHAELQVAAEIQTLPTQVDADVAKHTPKTDKIYYKGITLTIGGFAAAETVYRTRNNVADIGSNYSKIPYNNSVLA